jgi:hypothetical protein
MAGGHEWDFSRRLGGKIARGWDVFATEFDRVGVVQPSCDYNDIARILRDG